MASAVQWVGKLDAVISNWDTILGDGLVNARELAVELQQDQMLEGKRSTGRWIGDYSSTSKYFRKRLGRQTNYVDLYITGRYQGNLFVSISGNKYGFDSNVNYAKDIEKRYGTDIFGLTSESRRILWVEQMRGEVLSIVKGYTKT